MIIVTVYEAGHDHETMLFADNGHQEAMQWAYEVAAKMADKNESAKRLHVIRSCTRTHVCSEQVFYDDNANNLRQRIDAFFV